MPSAKPYLLSKQVLTHHPQALATVTLVPLPFMSYCASGRANMLPMVFPNTVSTSLA